MRHRPSTTLLTALLSGALTLGAMGACSRGSPSSSGQGPSSDQPQSSSQSSSTDTASTATGGAPQSEPSTPSTQQSPAQDATSAGPLDAQEQDPSSAPAWGTGTEGQEAPQGSLLSVADVRVGSHPEEHYTRVVVELDGQGSPGWKAPQWDVSTATMGKGEPITVDGDHTLVITGSGTASVTPPGQRSMGHRRIDVDDHQGDDEGIDEVYVDPGFEGQFQVVLGTDSQVCRVFTLSSPTRLVIDVADDDDDDSVGADGG